MFPFSAGLDSSRENWITKEEQGVHAEFGAKNRRHIDSYSFAFSFIRKAIPFRHLVEFRLWCSKKDPHMKIRKEQQNAAFVAMAKTRKTWCSLNLDFFARADFLLMFYINSQLFQRIYSGFQRQDTIFVEHGQRTQYTQRKINGNRKSDSRQQKYQSGQKTGFTHFFWQNALRFEDIGTKKV